MVAARKGPHRADKGCWVEEVAGKLIDLQSERDKEIRTTREINSKKSLHASAMHSDVLEWRGGG